MFFLIEAFKCVIRQAEVPYFMGKIQKSAGAGKTQFSGHLGLPLIYLKLRQRHAGWVHCTGTRLDDQRTPQLTKWKGLEGHWGKFSVVTLLMKAHPVLDKTQQHDRKIIRI